MTDKKTDATQLPARPRALGEVAIRCADLGAMTAFYRDFLGMAPLEGGRADIAFFQLGADFGGHITVLALFAAESGAPGGVSSLHHIALTVGAGEQDAAITWCRECGVEHKVEEFDWIGWRGLFLTDPEGNTIELVAALRPPPPEMRLKLAAPITRALFEAASNGAHLSSAERRRRRAGTWRRMLPPGFYGSDWIVAKDFKYIANDAAPGEEFLVEAGFQFDGASTPPVLSWLIPATHSMYLGAAALHDRLYRDDAGVERAKADDLMREAMLVLGTNAFWTWVVWRGVRAGGWMFYHDGQADPRTRRLLRFGRLGRWAGYGWVLFRWLGAIVFVDLWRVGAYRRQANRIWNLTAKERA